MKSLSEAAAYAGVVSITTELVLVFDRSDEATKAVGRVADCHGFVRVKYLETDHGCLGSARNLGIDGAEGKYIWTADQDDLVSYNCIAAMYEVAEKDANAVVFPKYVIAFGESFYTARYFDDSLVTSADFVYYNPYISRIFMRRAVFRSLRFQDLSVSTGFAYEDWHLNCELRAMGMAFRIAPRTVLFYRQTGGSLLKEFDRKSARVIPHSLLFDPDQIGRCVAADAAARPADLLSAARDTARAANVAKEILSDRVTAELLVAAIDIDPGINLYQLRNCDQWLNLWPNHHWGHDYATACSVVGSAPFTDIVLLPFLGAGGGERFILDVLGVLAAEVAEFRCLVICGEAASSHAWLDRLPTGAVFLDVYNAFPTLSDEERRRLVLRLILAVRGKSARLHLKPSAFATSLFSRFADIVSREIRTVYYRFTDDAEILAGVPVEVGWGFEFLSQEIERLALVVTDHHRIRNRDIDRFGIYTEKWRCLYAARGVPAVTSRSRPVFRLLWAARICAQKRPDLLPAIVVSARQIVPDLVVCVAGPMEESSEWLSILNETTGLEYLGPFDGFDGLGPAEYDGLIYTSKYDGLPIVILDAMSWGMPVIAPDIGGIPEAVVDGETGWLMPGWGTDDELVRAYAAAIEKMYGDWGQALVLGEAGRRLVEQRHHPDVHRDTVREIFLGGGS
jgi:glycosyltransferase involved in cell wall biosynthesis